MVIFDATTLLLLVAPQAATPVDSDGKLIEFASDRMQGLLRDLSKKKQKIIIPTPALSEVFVRINYSEAALYVEKLKKSRHFKVEPFCELAALEVAVMTGRAVSAGSKREGSDATWAKIKYDRQIVAIAAVHRAETIYTDDANLRLFASGQGLGVIGLADLPIPDEKAQIDWVNEAEGEAGPGR